jgi:hypothetical protein
MRALETLRELDMVQIRTSQGQVTTVVTIVNWTLYQGEGEGDGQVSDKSRTSHVQVPLKGIQEQKKETTLESEEIGQKEKAEHLAFDRWNPFATKHGLATVRTVTPARVKKIQAREKDGTLDSFDETLERIAESDFLLGRNGRGWKVTFDYLIRSTDTFTRILEGAHGTARKPSAGNEPESFRGSTDFDGL